MIGLGAALLLSALFNIVLLVRLGRTRDELKVEREKPERVIVETRVLERFTPVPVDLYGHPTPTDRAPQERPPGFV